MLYTILLSVVSTTLLSQNVFAAYNDDSTCTFYRPGVPSCSGLVTSDVADYIGYFLDGAEDYALIKHPYGIYMLVSVDYVWWPSTACDLFINGLFAVVVDVNGTYYAHPTVGCTTGTILSKNNNRLVETTRTITYAELYETIMQQNSFCSYEVPCNILEQRTLYGPNPVQENFVTGGNVLIHTTSLQSCILTAQNGKTAQFEKGARQIAYKEDLNVSIKSAGSKNLVITLNRRPRAPPCVPQNFNLFPTVKDLTPITSMQPNSGCYLSTLVAQQFASPTYKYSPLTYVEITIFERRRNGTIWFPGYLTTTIFDSLLDSLLTAC